jgi:plastocyanin
MNKRIQSKQLFLSGIFLAVMVLSAVMTGFLSARTDNADAMQSSKQGAQKVNIYDETVSPNTISVKVGETVTINNKSSEAKELSLGSGEAGHETIATTEMHADTAHQHDKPHDHSAGFSSGVFDVDEAWQVTFSKPGTYFLHDHSNPKLNILVVVY